MKRIIIFTTLLALVFSAGACAQTKEKKNMQSNDSRVLVAWFSWSGKTVIPFCTAYTGPYNTLKDIAKATPTAEHKDGHALITKEMGGTGIDKKFSEIDSWLKSVGFNLK